jgi:hypothetical protein
MKTLAACAAGPVRFSNGVTVSTHRGAIQLLPHEGTGHGEATQRIAGALQSLKLRDGLDARCVNAHPFGLWLAFHLSLLLRFSPKSPWFARRYRAQIGPVATMGFLSGALWDPRDAFPMGRFLSRFWLECARLRYRFQPYAWVLGPYGAAAGGQSLATLIPLRKPLRTAPAAMAAATFLE